MCQKAFAGLHGISLSRVRRLAQSVLTSICAPADKRGKHSNRPKKISLTIRKQVKEHIKSYPAMRSHYFRSKNKKRRYLSLLLSIADMHRLYIEKHEEDSSNPVVKYSFYFKIFIEEFNLSFGHPKTDTCGT